MHEVRAGIVPIYLDGAWTTNFTLWKSRAFREFLHTEFIPPVVDLLVRAASSSAMTEHFMVVYII
jgi:hypothetical protein